MMRVPVLRLMAVVAAIALLGLPVGWYAVFGRTRIIDLAPGVFVLHTASFGKPIGGNVAVVAGDSSVLVFDTELAPLAGRIRRLIARRTAAPIRTIVNSHWHPDHNGGNERLRRADTEILAHPMVQSRLASGSEGFGLTRPGSHHVFQPRPPEALPTAGVEDQQVRTAGPEQVILRHAPAAHTGGDTWAFLPGARVALVGDLVWPGSYPFVDTRSGGTVPGLIEALRFIRDQVPDDVTLVPGHGLPFGKDTLEAYLAMLERTSSAVMEQRARGRSLAEIQAAGFSSEDLRWTSRLTPASEWIRMIFETTVPREETPPGDDR